MSAQNNIHVMGKPTAYQPLTMHKLYINSSEVYLLHTRCKTSATEQWGYEATQGTDKNLCLKPYFSTQILRTNFTAVCTTIWSVRSVLRRILRVREHVCGGESEWTLATWATWHFALGWARRRGFRFHWYMCTVCKWTTAHTQLPQLHAYN